MSVPVNGGSLSIPTGTNNVITSGSSNITLSSANTTTGVLVNDGSGNLVWRNSGTSIIFSIETLTQIFKELETGKYTKKYAEVYLEFMFLNAMLDNLEYLEFKTLLSKEYKQ